MWQDMSFKDFLVDAREKNIICFGTGEYLEIAIKLLEKHGLKISYAVDNNFWKSGTIVSGIEIDTLDRLIYDELEKICVLVCDLAIYNIVEQLQEAGINNFFALPLFAEEWYGYQNRFIMKIPFSDRTPPKWRQQCFITPVNACNLSCSFCAFAENSTTGEVMPYEAFLRIAEQLKFLKINGQKVDTVRLDGNREGLLHPRFSDIAQHLDSIGINCRLVTNGFLMTNEVATVLARHLRHIRISVTGITDDVYHHFQGSERANSSVIFNTVVDNVVRLVEIRNSQNSSCYIDIGFICTELSAHQIKDAIIFWKKKGIDRIIFFYENSKDTLPLKNAEDNDISYTSENGAREVCFYTTTIAANGDVYPCCSPYGEYMPIGNCFTNTLNEIFSSQAFYIFRKKLATLNPEQLPYKCRRCTVIAQTSGHKFQNSGFS
jgi:radical SAM protein with 4Fe4S-binding SPASM domain